MYRVAKKENFSPTTFLWEVVAEDLAAAAQAGQFVMIRLNESGERIPLTIADIDRDRGTITLVVKVAGKTTAEMERYPQGAKFSDLTGPLGCPTKIETKGHVVLVGGGLGIAPLYPILKAFKKSGARVTTVVGFRSQGEIFWEARFRELSDRLVLMTEDGSAGRKGTTIDGLQDILQEGVVVDEVLTVGPLGMMQAVAELTRPHHIPTVASMNPIMVDGIGMCGSCRVKVGDKILFACVDGPDMDAHQVDFDDLKRRQRRFTREEECNLRAWKEL